MSAPRPLLVTGLFDLARREPETGRVTADRYLELAGDFVLGLGHDLVVFAEPEVAEAIEEGRRRHGLGERTRVIAIAFEELPAHELLGEITAARARNPLRNGNPAKDTPLYTALMWSKLELVARAAALDPAATHLAWIDIALPFRPHPGEDPFAHPTERVRLLRMRPLFERELADLPAYFTLRFGHIAGGYIGGSREQMLWLAERLDVLARELLADGIAGSDEQLLPVIAAAEPERFETHCGDYPHILANYFRPHGSAGNLTYQLRALRDESAFDRSAPLAQAVVESVEDGCFEAHPHELAGLLDECYLAGWYGEDGDHSLARRAHGLYMDRVERDPGFRDAFLRDEIRMRRNFAFLDE